MKITKRAHLQALGLALTITAFGCRTHPITLNSPPSDGPKMSGTISSDPSPAIVFTPKPLPDSLASGNRGIPPNASGSHEGWAEDRLTLRPQTVYFDFDKSAINAGEQSKLDEVANYLQKNAGVAIRIEGNCDERGTEEYNRSLGERRALAAREHLVRLGVESGRIDSLSNGEDKPAEAGHDKSAWAKNRRDEFVILAPPNFLSLSGH